MQIWHKGREFTIRPPKNPYQNSASAFVKAAGPHPSRAAPLRRPLTFPQHAISSPRHISCVICLFSPPDAKREAFVFPWSGWRGWCLSFLRSFEKAVILHEKRAPQATSVTSGVTLTDRVQSWGLTMLLLAANPIRTDSVFGAESNKVGSSFSRECAGATLLHRTWLSSEMKHLAVGVLRHFQFSENFVPCRDPHEGFCISFFLIWRDTLKTC